MKSRYRFIYASLMMVFLAQWFIGDGLLFASTSKDIILVLDTSLSMRGANGAGYKGKDIFDRVKKSISEYIDKIGDGDRVTFMTFDADVKIYPTVLVDDSNDRDILKKYISMTEAKGLWTYTYKMFTEVFKKADLLEKEDTGRQTLIVVMTDAFDDPPPGAGGQHIDVKEFLTRYGQKDWWVYYVSFSQLKDNKNLAKMREQLQKDLNKITKGGGVVIDAGTNIDKASTDFQTNVAEQESQTCSPLCYIIAAVILVLLVFLIIFFLRKRSAARVFGRIEYWQTSVIDPYVNSFDLTKHPVREVIIGKGVGCSLNIRDYELEIPFKIVAVKGKSGVQLKLQGGPNYPLSFVNRKEGDILEDGDIFHAGNYSFKYFSA